MSQHVTPGDLAGTIGATKGRVSRLERELSNLRRTSEQPTVQQVLVVPPWRGSGVFPPGGDDIAQFVVAHPTGANLLSVTFMVFTDDGAETTPQNATVTILTSDPGSQWPNPRPVETPGGEPYWEIPYTGGWSTAARLETARTWIPPLAPVAFSIHAPLDTVNVRGGVAFEFDTGKRRT